MKIKTKLLGNAVLNSILIISLLFIVVYLGERVYKASKQTLYDEAYTSISLILNADRDFYQALVAQQDYDLLKIKDEKDAAKKDYEENMAQTSERVSKAIQAVEKDKIFWENINSRLKNQPFRWFVKTRSLRSKPKLPRKS